MICNLEITVRFSQKAQRQNGGIGRHSRLKICWALRPWEFESPFCHTNTIYIMYAYARVHYIYIQGEKKVCKKFGFQKKKQYNCTRVWRILHLIPFNFSEIPTIFQDFPPKKKIGRPKIALKNVQFLHLVLIFLARYLLSYYV